MSTRGSLLLGLAVALVLVLIFFDSSPSSSGVVEPPNPSRLPDGVVPDTANQVIIVTADAWSENKAQVAAFERDGDDWDKAGGDFSARIGRNGFARVGDTRTELTPSGHFPLVSSFGAVENPGTAIPYRTAGSTDCWITDSSSQYFNQWVLLEGCASPNVPLDDPSGPLELAIVASYSPAPGSTATVPLLMHRYEYSDGQAPLPTTGSVSMRREDLLDLLLWLDPSKQPIVLLGVDDWLLGNEGTEAAPSEWEDLAYGSEGPSVSAVQQALTNVGIPTKVDGLFYEETRQSVQTFQQAKGLPMTGVVDAETARMLGVYAGDV